MEIPAVDIDLFETGLIDSLVFIDLLLALEEEFSMEIALDRVNLDDFRSIARIASFISLQNNPIEEMIIGWHSASGDCVMRAVFEQSTVRSAMSVGF